MKRYIIMTLAMLLSAGAVMAQIKVSGVVTDESGAPLIGATVIIKGTSIGTSTDLKGAFTLNNVKGSATLQAAYIGFVSKEVAVNNRTSVDIKLAPSSIQLEDVVAIGYGTVSRRDLTGSVGSVSASDIIKSATSNYDQALAGRIAGVQVSATDGTPGEGLNIIIRGGNSITGDNSPLYVVDGVPFENFDPGTLSSNDIKEIDVLKDASSTAIYGSRGANGVVLITTKSGRTDGRTDIMVNGSYGVAWVPTRLQVMSPYDYARYQLEVAYASDGYNPGEKVKGYMKTWGNPENYRNAKGTSWQDEIMRSAPIRNANITLSGGNDKTSIYYSGEILDQQGTLLNTSFMKIINNLKFTHKFGKGTKVSGQLQYTYTNREGINVSGNNYTSIIRDAIQYRPIEPITDDGRQEGGYDPTDDNDKYLYNPVKSLENTDRRNRSNTIRGVVAVEQTFNKNWKAVLSGNFQNADSKQSVFYGLETQQGQRGNDGISGSITNSRVTNFTGSAVLHYNYNCNKSRFAFMAGTEATQQQNEINTSGNALLPTDIFGIDKIGLGTAPKIPTSYKGMNSLASFFGRINYTYADKYLLTFNMRADGSSKFSKGNRWGYFPSFSAAWRLNQENFLKDIDWLTNIKLRAGWGLTGNNRIGDYDFISYLNVITAGNETSGYIWGQGEGYVPGAIQANLGVPDLRWETTSQTSVGLDLGFLNNRLTATIEGYYKRTYDLLLNADMALSTGFTKVQQNVGSVSNKGMEFTINSVNINRKNFVWNTTFNISFNRNKVLSLNGGQREILTNPEFTAQLSEYAYISQVGKPVGMMYGLQYERLYTWDDFVYNNDNGTFALKKGVPDNGNASLAPGNIKYVDRNNDGTINELDRTIIGDPTPKHFGGLTNDFIIARNFDCQIFLQWSYGGQILNGNRSVVGIAQNKWFNTLGYGNNYWSPYHTASDINAIRYETYFGMPVKGNEIDSRAVEDGSYLKLKSVSVGYSLPAKTLAKLRMKKLRVFVSAQNLYTWTKYSGYDPDVSVGKYGALTPRLDYSAYPQSTTIMAGAEIIF